MPFLEGTHCLPSVATKIAMEKTKKENCKIEELPPMFIKENTGKPWMEKDSLRNQARQEWSPAPTYLSGVMEKSKSRSSYGLVDMKCPQRTPEPIKDLIVQKEHPKGCNVQRTQEPPKEPLHP
ncbi:hypothetical protein CR513_34253, partial [Mucuna pruriens]